MIDMLTSNFAVVQAWLFETIVQPFLFWSGLGEFTENAFEGTEWFLIRDGKIAEVRAYHHGNKRNPSGDLLGFDHAARGHTVL